MELEHFRVCEKRFVEHVGDGLCTHPHRHSPHTSAQALVNTTSERFSGGLGCTPVRKQRHIGPAVSHPEKPIFLSFFCNENYYTDVLHLIK
jgi:hypothetical protein